MAELFLPTIIKKYISDLDLLMLSERVGSGGADLSRISSLLIHFLSNPLYALTDGMIPYKLLSSIVNDLIIHFDLKYLVSLTCYVTTYLSTFPAS